MPPPLLTCGRCAATGEITRVQGMLTEPPGWTCATLTTMPVTNRQLCPACSTSIESLLRTPPEVFDRLNDQLIERAFARGYDDGVSDARRTAETGERPA